MISAGSDHSVYKVQLKTDKASWKQIIQSRRLWKRSPRIYNQKTAISMPKILNPNITFERRAWGKLHLISGSKYESEQGGKANQMIQLPSEKEKRKSESISLTEYSICNNPTAVDFQIWHSTKSLQIARYFTAAFYSLTEQEEHRSQFSS